MSRGVCCLVVIALLSCGAQKAPSSPSTADPGLVPDSTQPPTRTNPPPTRGGPANPAPSQEPPPDSAPAPGPTVGIVPLMDGPGLYPSGQNSPPAEHVMKGREIAETLRSRSKNVLLSVGMSNTRLEFDAFVASERSKGDIAANLDIVNGASDGQTARRWASMRNSTAFQLADAALSAASATPNDVGVVWVKLTNEADATIALWRPRFKTDLRQTLLTLAAHYPNLKMMFLSSRVFGGCERKAPVQLNPEPYAFETGPVVKEIVAEHLSGSLLRNLWIGWGPYLWADGATPRSDGLTWECSDFTSAGVHPNAKGSAKVASLLSAFLRDDPVARTWFVRNP